jgi:hypothetical protein
MKKKFALSRSLARDPRKRGAVSASPVSRAPPANQNKGDNGRVGALRRNRNGKERKNQPCGSLTVIRTEPMNLDELSPKTSKTSRMSHLGTRYVGTSYLPTYLPTYMDE